VVKLQGNSVDPTDPQENQILTWSKNNQDINVWLPKFQELNAHSDVDVVNHDLIEGNILTWNGEKQKWVAGHQQAQAKLLHYLPFVTITPLDSSIFELWFNIDAPENKVKIESIDNKIDDDNDYQRFSVFLENDDPQSEYPYLEKIKIEDINLRKRNVYKVDLVKSVNYDFLRFVFDLNKIEVKIFLFNWKEIVNEEDNKKLTDFLEQKFNIDEIKDAKIRKSESKINVTTKNNKIILALKKEKVEFHINDKKLDIFNADDALKHI